MTAQTKRRIQQGWRMREMGTDAEEARMVSTEKGNRALRETLRQRPNSGNIIVTLFGKRQSELTPDEEARYRRLAKTTSYYRRHHQHKVQQRKDKSWVKLDIIETMGWPVACDECGYDKYVGALDFHHLDPAVKDGKVTTVEEARKCRLLCSNCHREAHANDRKQGKFISTGRPVEAADPMLEAYMRLSGLSEDVIARAMAGRPHSVAGVKMWTGILDSVAGSTWTEAEQKARQCPRFLNGLDDACTCDDRTHEPGRLGDGTVCEEADRPRTRPERRWLIDAQA